MMRFRPSSVRFDVCSERFGLASVLTQRCGSAALNLFFFLLSFHSIPSRHLEESNTLELPVRRLDFSIVFDLGGLSCFGILTTSALLLFASSDIRHFLRYRSGFNVVAAVPQILFDLYFP